MLRLVMTVPGRSFRAVARFAYVLLIVIGLGLAAGGLLGGSAGGETGAVRERGRTVLLGGDSSPVKVTELRSIGLWNDGSFLVSDAGGQLLRFGRDGSFQGTWGEGIGPPLLRDSRGLTIDAAGIVYIADRASGKALKIGPDGRLADGIGLGETFGVTGIRTDSSGRIFVTDTGRNRVLVLDSAGKLLRFVGDDSKGPTIFKQPAGMALGPTGKMYVANLESRLVQVLTPEGGVVTSIKPAFEPYGVAVDAQENVYVSSTAVPGVHVFNRQGKLIGAIGTFTSPPFLEAVKDVAIGNDGGLLVVSARAVTAVSLEQEQAGAAAAVGPPTIFGGLFVVLGLAVRFLPWRRWGLPGRLSRFRAALTAFSGMAGGRVEALAQRPGCSGGEGRPALFACPSPGWGGDSPLIPQ